MYCNLYTSPKGVTSSFLGYWDNSQVNFAGCMEDELPEVSDWIQTKLNPFYTLGPGGREADVGFSSTSSEDLLLERYLDPECRALFPFLGGFRVPL